MENEVDVVKHAVDQVKFAGYRDDSTADMVRNAIAGGGKELKVYPNAKRYEEGLASSELILNYSEKTGKYYLNNINMSVKADNPAIPVRAYSFRLDKDNKWTQKQAYNMLMGRAVYKSYKPKEKDAYEAWFQFDFNKTEKQAERNQLAPGAATESKTQKDRGYAMIQYHPKWGFDLDEVLSKFKILDRESRQELPHLASDLKRGNLQPVLFATSDGQLIPGYTEAAPAHKSLNNYDENKIAFPEGHELSGLYQGNNARQIKEHQEGIQTKEQTAQPDKKGPELVAPADTPGQAAKEKATRKKSRGIS